jgi:hypothetical protein
MVESAYQPELALQLPEPISYRRVGNPHSLRLEYLGDGLDTHTRRSHP